MQNRDKEVELPDNEDKNPQIFIELCTLIIQNAMALPAEEPCKH